jgi:hypothetical protein
MAHTLMPGGGFTFKMKNVTYGGDRQHWGAGNLMSPQHCGMPNYNGGHPGGTCAIHFLLEDVDFS